MPSAKGGEGFCQGCDLVLCVQYQPDASGGGCDRNDQYLLNALETGADPMDQIWLYAGLGVVTVAVLFVLHYFQYASLYLATYRESASRRVSLAETLRKLPLELFRKPGSE